LLCVQPTGAEEEASQTSSAHQGDPYMLRRHPLIGQVSLLVVVISTVVGCGSSAPPVAETPPPPVTVSQPVAPDVIGQDDYEGRIAAVETVEVRAKVRGYLDKVNFQDGQMVKEGDLLFEIDPRPYKAALDAAEAQKAVADAGLELARKEYARTSSLA